MKIVYLIKYGYHFNIITRFATFLLSPHHLLLCVIFNTFILVSFLFHPSAEGGILS